MSRCGVCSCAALAQSSGSPPSRQGLPETGEVGIEHSRQSSVCSTSVSSASLDIAAMAKVKMKMQAITAPRQRKTFHADLVRSFLGSVSSSPTSNCMIA